MAEQQFTDAYEAPEADAAEQSLPVVGDEDEDREAALTQPQPPLEANPADAAEQAVSVPMDEDEYR